MMKTFVYIFFFAILILPACSQNSSKNLNGGFEKLDHDVIQIDKYVDQKTYADYGVATFAGGCFWCTEAAFERIDGVVDVISGYSGGIKSYPTYNEIGTGTLKHAEAIQIYYDKSKIDFETLLDVFFVAHDPTTLNRQGPDRGPQYRSAIFYHDAEQKRLIAQKIAYLTENKKFEDPIVTEVASYDIFWVAEGYHQNFYELNPNQSYVRNVSRPKVEKVIKTFPQLLKTQYKTKP